MQDIFDKDDILKNTITLDNIDATNNEHICDKFENNSLNLEVNKEYYFFFKVCFLL